MYYNKYYYDEANQLVREDNRLGDFTGTYTYDVGGNIVSRIRYPYTEGEITGLNATETHTYSYTDGTWGDILTAYNGQNVTYDAMGNITSLDGDTYTWTAGRQLSRITKADNTYIDYFYDDGGQISKLVMYNEEGVSEGGYEYFWEGTTLIGTKTLPGTTDTEEDTYFTRIIYDTEGEPLGFLLNDALPFLYTKNILGDITGVINYETSEYLFRYSYDAYGNYELIPTGNDVGSVLFATILSGLNPLSYRGYIFTPAIGISHYLGSRYYDPVTCRFVNVDAFVSTGTGILGHNMFAYCNNNPVVYVDNTGTAHVPGIDACGPVSHKYDYGTTFSFGGSFGYTSGNYSVNETYVISSAKNRNEIQKTTSEGTAIGIGASIGVTFMITNANSIYDLRGQSNSVGATLINFFGITIDYVEFNPKSNSSVLCWGLCFTLPVGVETEIHEYTCNTEKIKQCETPLSSFLKKILSRWEE